MLLKDKIAIITGIGIGSGRSIALAFAEHGAKLVIGARNEAYINEVADEVRALGGEVFAVRTDVGKKEDCDAIVAKTVAEFGGVDVLVQNGHSVADYGNVVHDADLANWQTALDVNLFGALHLYKACFPHMKAKGDGRIILINSGAANYKPPHGLSAYAASKAAMASMARSIAVEDGQYGIRANSVHYGPMGEKFMPTMEMVAKQTGRTAEEELKDYCDAELALKYLPSAEESAGTAVFLASDLARVVTGQSISCNGGQWFGF